MEGGIIVKDLVVQKNPNKPKANSKVTEQRFRDKFNNLPMQPTPNATPMSERGISFVLEVKNRSFSSMYTHKKATKRPKKPM